MKKQTCIPVLIILLQSACLLLFAEGETVSFNINQAIDTALKNNREFILTGKEISIAEKNLKLMYRNFLPEINLGYSEYTSVSYWNPDSREKKISIELKQRIYEKGRLSSAVKIMKKETALGRFEITQQLEDFIFELISSYVDLLRIKIEIDISNDAVESAYLQLKIAEKEKELGEITEVDLLEMELAVTGMDEDLQNLYLEEKKIIFEFSRLLELPSGLYPELEGKINPDYNGFLDKSIDYYIENSARSSSTIKELMLSLEKAENEYRLASDKFPEVSAAGSFFIAGDNFPLTEKGFSISLSLSFNNPGIPSSITGTAGSENPNERSRSLTAETTPFGGLENLYLKQSAEASLKRREYELRSFFLNNEFEIRELFTEIESGVKELGLLRRKLKVSERKAEIEKLQLSLGEIKRIDFIENGIAFVKEKIRLLDSVSALYRKEIRLLRLCGIINIKDTAGFIIR